MIGSKIGTGAPLVTTTHGLLSGKAGMIGSKIGTGESSSYQYVVYCQVRPGWSAVRLVLGSPLVTTTHGLLSGKAGMIGSKIGTGESSSYHYPRSTVR